MRSPPEGNTRSEPLKFVKAHVLDAGPFVLIAFVLLYLLAALDIEGGTPCHSLSTRAISIPAV